MSCSLSLFNKQNGRPSSAYFPPSNFAEDTFYKDESVFSKKLSSGNFVIFFFQIYNLSDFRKKKSLNSGEKRHVYEIISSDTIISSSTASLPLLANLKEKTDISTKNTAYFMHLSNLTISVVAFYSKLEIQNVKFRIGIPAQAKDWNKIFEHGSGNKNNF